MLMKRISYFASLKAIMLFAFLYIIGGTGLSHAQKVTDDELAQVIEADSTRNYLHIVAAKDTSSQVVFYIKPHNEYDRSAKLLSPGNPDRQYYLFTTHKYAKITLENDSLELTYDGHFDFQRKKETDKITTGKNNSDQLGKDIPRAEGWIILKGKEKLIFTDNNNTHTFLLSPIDSFRNELSLHVDGTRVNIDNDTIKIHEGDTITLKVGRYRRGLLKRIAWSDNTPICDSIETEQSAKYTSYEWDTIVAIPHEAKINSLLIQCAYFDKDKGEWLDNAEISIPVVVLSDQSNSSHSIILWLVLAVIIMILFDACVFKKNKIAKKRVQTPATEENKTQNPSQGPNNSTENGIGTQNGDEDKQEDKNEEKQNSEDKHKTEENYDKFHEQKQPSWQEQFINAWNKECISPRLKEEDAPRLIQIFVEGYLDEEKRAEWDVMQQWKSQIIKDYKLKENTSFEDIVSTYENDIYQKGYNDNNKSRENKESDANALKYKAEWKAMLEELNKKYHVSIDLNILETKIEDLHSLIIEKIKEITTQADDIEKETTLNELKEKHQNDVEKLLQKEKEIRELKKEHENELQKKDREKETALNELKEKHKADVRKQAETHTTEIENLEKNIQTKEEALKELKKHACDEKNEALDNFIAKAQDISRRLDSLYQSACELSGESSKYANAIRNAVDSNKRFMAQLQQKNSPEEWRGQESTWPEIRIAIRDLAMNGLKSSGWINIICYLNAYAGATDELNATFAENGLSPEELNMLQASVMELVGMLGIKIVVPHLLTDKFKEEYFKFDNADQWIRTFTSNLNPKDYADTKKIFDVSRIGFQVEGESYEKPKVFYY